MLIILFLPLLIEPSWLDRFRSRAVSFSFWRQTSKIPPVARRKTKRKNKKKNNERNVACRSGFELVDNVCVDIDECQLGFFIAKFLQSIYFE